MFSYITETKHLISCQSGLHGVHSTIAALVEATNGWVYNIDHGNVNAVMFLDLKKAYETVNHEILLGKLIYLWVKYLTDSRGRVFADDTNFTYASNNIYDINLKFGENLQMANVTEWLSANSRLTLINLVPRLFVQRSKVPGRSWSRDVKIIDCLRGVGKVSNYTLPLSHFKLQSQGVSVVYGIVYGQIYESCTLRLFLFALNYENMLNRFYCKN